MKEYVWYDVRENQFVITKMDLANCCMEALKGNCPNGIKRIETNETYNRGRLIGIDDNVLEYIGEL